MANLRKIQPRDQWVLNASGQVAGLMLDGINAPVNFKSSKVDLTASRNALPTDDGNVLVNNTASNYTVTIQAGEKDNFGFALVQGSTGTCTIAAGASVTLIGATLATSAAGGILAAVWVSPNTYVIKAS